MSKSRLAPIARAFAEQAIVCAPHDLGALADGAIALVRKAGGSLVVFTKLVRSELTRVDPVRQAAIVVAQGDGHSLEHAVKATSKHVHTTVSVNPKLLGGAVVRMGDMRLDNSVRGQLSRAARSILENITPHIVTP